MTDVVEWTDMRITLGGEPFPVEHVTYERKPLNPMPIGRIERGEYTVEASMLMSGASNFLENFFPPPPKGATNMTLAKRVSYGGRKGRSALRRLREQGYVGILKINDEAPVPCPPITIYSAALPGGKE